MDELKVSHAPLPIAPEKIRVLASQLHPQGILSPKIYDDAQDARERLITAFARLAQESGEYLSKKCDTLIIDQRSGNLPGIFFKQLCAEIYKKTGRVAPQIHDAIGSLSLPDREKLLTDYFRQAFKEGTIGDHILIVTEHVISKADKALITFSDLLTKVGTEFRRNVEVRIAALSIGHVSPTRLQAAARLTESNPYTWYAGEFGRSIGSIAFHRDGTSDLVYGEGSARPQQLEIRDDGPNGEWAKQDMIDLAKSLSDLAVKPS